MLARRQQTLPRYAIVASANRARGRRSLQCVRAAQASEGGTEEWAVFLQNLTAAATRIKSMHPGTPFPALGPLVVEAAFVFGDNNPDPTTPTAALPPATKDNARLVMVLHGAGDAIGYRRGSWEFNKSARDLHFQCRTLGGVPGLDVTGSGWIVSDDTVRTARVSLGETCPRSPRAATDAV